jgi:1-acyl-sn-glycerol-3-phosphate acyltransferase
MIWLRSIIFALGMWLYTPLFVIVALVICIPLSPKHRYHIISRWAHHMFWWLRITCGISYQVEGKENIPSEPCVVLSKHQSMWETMAVQLIFPPQVWVLKRELMWIPFFGWGLAMTSPIAINRGTAREALKQLVKQGKDRLDRGLFVVLFPEGTRIAPGKRGKYHIGGAWLATQTKTPVVPVAHNAGEFWGKKSFFKKPGIIKVSIGKPIQSSHLKADALNQQVEDWIEEKMLTLSK